MMPAEFRTADRIFVKELIEICCDLFPKYN